MNVMADVIGARKRGRSAELVLSVQDRRVMEAVRKKDIRRAELRLDDGRSITIEQRKKIYATVRDIAD